MHHRPHLPHPNLSQDPVRGPRDEVPQADHEVVHPRSNSKPRGVLLVSRKIQMQMKGRRARKGPKSRKLGAATPLHLVLSRTRSGSPPATPSQSEAFVP